MLCTSSFTTFPQLSFRHHCTTKELLHWKRNNKCSRNEVVAMEWLVTEVLNFQCFVPTIYNFLWFCLKAAKDDAKVEQRAKYLAVLALSDHDQLRYWPSTVAAGIVVMTSIFYKHLLGRSGGRDIHIA
ncbi:hypothetical protein GOBAR_AA12333 [Gossypium barbadense]|uniref:Cyclin C-terminal domain-containing protein n=1 Tax=Gossypium barbadense TaxID=3634 RepID=A0A2P5XY90_GOSBA|nr:hypothetical protein GOBAR_AA12333 [Gossypium barbadense]